MSITITVERRQSGAPLTAAGARGKSPWTTTPEFPQAAEQAPDPVVTRLSGSAVNVAWSPLSGQPAQEAVNIYVEITGSPKYNKIAIDWGDGSPVEFIPAMSFPDYSFRRSHVYQAAASQIRVDTVNGSFIVDTGILSFSPVLSSYWAIGQYRIERFKGSHQYGLLYKRWIPDWSPFTGAAHEMNLTDYEAPGTWNWGYRIWLRSIDDQELPDLTMVPSNWVETGTGEGS